MPSGFGLVPLGKGIVLFQEEGRAGGYEDFLEVDEFKFNTSVEKVEKDSNRTSEVKTIMSAVKKTKVSGSIIVAATPLELMRFFALADSVTTSSQASSTLADVAYTAYKNKWIDLGKVDLSSVKVLNTGIAVVAANATDDFTATAHGLANGTPVEFLATAFPDTIVADTTYYVVNAAANTFQVSTTVGGSAVTFTTDGTSVVVHQICTLGTDYEVNTDHGWLFATQDGIIVDATSVKVSASYAAVDMQVLEALNKATIKGTLVFLGDPVEGPRYRFDAYVRIDPEGDFNMIAQDPTTMQINFEALESATRLSAGKGLYTLTDVSGLSKAVAAV